MQCWLDLISDFIYLFFYTFLVEWENCVFPRFFARPVITTSTSGLFQPPQELLELQEESSLRTMLCKMWPNWEFTMEPLTSHFGTWSKWEHWYALYCLQSSEKNTTSAKSPLTTVWLPRWLSSDVMVVIALGNRSDREASARLIHCKPLVSWSYKVIGLRQ